MPPLERTGNSFDTLIIKIDAVNEKLTGITEKVTRIDAQLTALFWVCSMAVVEIIYCVIIA